METNKNNWLIYMSFNTINASYGYDNKIPFNNINNKFVNTDGSHYSGNFSSSKIPTSNAYNFYGGAKKLKKKIKNITKHYRKMKTKHKINNKIKNVKRTLKNRHVSRQLARQFAGKRTKKHKTRKQKGGYAQYQNNLPLSSTYQVAGISLSANDSALANPAPIKMLDNNAVDNYNHFTGTGFDSRGH